MLKVNKFNVINSKKKGEIIKILKYEEKVNQLARATGKSHDALNIPYKNGKNHPFSHELISVFYILIIIFFLSPKCSYLLVLEHNACQMLTPTELERLSGCSKTF